MFGVSETPYDLRFHALGIPVRVHPLFWLGSALLAGNSNDLPLIVTWVACVFISILVHEYGHGLMAKAVDSSPSIRPLDGRWSLLQPDGPRVTLAETRCPALRPGAGFLLAVVVMLITSAIFGLTPSEHLGVVLHLLGLPTHGFAFRSNTMSRWARVAAESMVS